MTAIAPLLLFDFGWRVLAVHVLIAGLYACLLWLSLMAYLLIVDGPWVPALILSPVLISGAILVLILLEALVSGALWLWRSRATWRWWRSQSPGRG